MPDFLQQQLASAIETFVKGFCFTRSLIYPYLPHRQGEGWVLRDAPGKKRALRTEEWVMPGTLPPAEVDALIRKNSQSRCALSLIGGTDDTANDLLKSQYKSLHWRLRTTEPFMLHHLEKIPRVELKIPITIQRVTTQKLADQLAKAARYRQIFPEFLPGNSREKEMRQYAALLNHQVVGWVRSIPVNDATWCSNMFVKEPHRRQGIARALLTQLLRDDHQFGARRAVLLASHIGEKLYNAVGYQRIGRLFLFTPSRR